MCDVTTHDLIATGLALVRIPYGQKAPVNTGWNQATNVITDPAGAAQLGGMNFGLAHAYCTPTPTCAIDIDFFRDAKPWLKFRGIDLTALLLAANSVVIWSGKPQSIKLLYRLPIGTSALQSKKIVGPNGKTALEFRCASKDGLTVQDILPPSLHPSGTHYQWIGEGSPLDIPVIPSALLAVWMTLLDPQKESAQHYRAGSTTCGELLTSPRQETPRQVAQVTAMLKHITADCDYDTWRNVVWAVLSTAWNCADDLALNWSKSAPNRFEDDAFWTIVNSFMPGHQNAPTLGSVYFHARQGGWNE